MRACVEQAARSNISRVGQPLPRAASVNYAPRIDATMPPAPVNTLTYSYQVIDRSCCVGALLNPRSGCNFLPCTSGRPSALLLKVWGLRQRTTRSSHIRLLLVQYGHSIILPKFAQIPPARPHEIVLTERVDFSNLLVKKYFFASVFSQIFAA
jgi:hypothetical protein